MLSIASWAVTEFEPPEVEREEPRPESGNLKSAERHFVCKETKNEEPTFGQRFLEKKESPEKELQSRTESLSKREIKEPREMRRTPLAKRVEQSATRALPRHLPRTEKQPSLPRPFQQTVAPKRGETAKQSALPRERNHVRGERKESETKGGEKREVQGQMQREAELWQPIDPDAERKRQWTYQAEDELQGAAKIAPKETIVPKQHSYKKIESSHNKPFLVRPRMGIYALYYILTKIGLISDSHSHFGTKDQIRINQEETDKTHKERLVELKKALDQEKSNKRWSVATQVFSWFTSFLGIMTGIALIMTGVGAVAGALLLCAGILMVTNQLMQLTGAWVKIAEKLPGTPEQKRAIIMWMQIGITVLCFLLSGAGIVFGGFTAVKEAMQASQAVMGGVIMMGYGTTSFGEGVSNYKHRMRMAEIRKYEIKLAKLKHSREDLQERVESSMSRIEQLFEEISRILEFEQEIFQADQKVIR